jgi:hypothetical protein
MNLKQKFTIAPIEWDIGLESLTKSFPIFSGASVESMRDKLTKASFDLWQRYVAEEERSKLEDISFALVHGFKSELEAGESEFQSEALVHQLFVCLRIIRPTRARFLTIQYELEENGKPYVLKFTHPDVNVINVPESEILNRVRMRDLLELRKLMPAFASVFVSGPAHVWRAIRYYEAGYADVRDPVLQFMVWMMGIEAAFQGDRLSIRSEEDLKNEINLELGARDIYEDSAEREVYDLEPLLVNSLLDDLFSLRNDFVHGAWIPDSFLNHQVRLSIAGQSLNRADVLRECASFLLRTRLLSQLSTTA